MWPPYAHEFGQKLPARSAAHYTASGVSGGLSPRPIRKILVSVKFVSAILGPEMAAPILGDCTARGPGRQGRQTRDATDARDAGDAGDARDARDARDAGDAGDARDAPNSFEKQSFSGQFVVVALRRMSNTTKKSHPTKFH